MNPPRLGFVGLGNMGGQMSARLIESGYDLAVFDPRREATDPLRKRGARVADSPSAVGSQTDIVFVSLPTPAIVREVATGSDGLVNGANFRTYVDLSTTGPEVAREVADRLKNVDVDVLDAPVSGGVKGAVAGTLAVMVSGLPEVFERCKPILQVLGKEIFYVGGAVGQAQAMKLINNFLSATALAATSEAVVLGKKAGLDPKRMIEVLNAGTGRNSATQDKFPKSILPRSFDAGFRTSLMCKDLNLCMEMARGLSIRMPLGGAINRLWTEVEQEEGGDSDFTEIIKYFEGRAGVEIR